MDEDGQQDASAEKTEAGRRLFRKENALRWIVLIGIAGVALIFLSSLRSTSDKQQQPAAVEDDTDEILAYRQSLTDELGYMLASMEGAGRTKIMLTLESGSRNIYAADDDVQQKKGASTDLAVQGSDQYSEKKTHVVIRRSDGSEQAVSEGRVMPSVRGVLIVCEGGGNKEIADKMREAAATALHIAASRVSVQKMSQ